MKFNEFIKEGVLDKKQNKDILNDVKKAWDILEKTNKKISKYAGFEYDLNRLSNIINDLEYLYHTIKKGDL